MGLPYEDPHEHVVYRVVPNLNVAEGWGTAAFWTRRWGCNYSDVLHLAQLGWLDAAIAAGTSVKRYRCRDEVRVLHWLEERAELEEMQARAREQVAAQHAPVPVPKFSKPHKVLKRFGKWGKK